MIDDGGVIGATEDLAVVVPLVVIGEGLRAGVRPPFRLTGLTLLGLGESGAE